MMHASHAHRDRSSPAAFNTHRAGARSDGMAYLLDDWRRPAAIIPASQPDRIPPADRVHRVGLGSLTVSPRHRLANLHLSGAQLAAALSAHADPQPSHTAWLVRAACQEAQAWGRNITDPTGLRATVVLAPKTVRGGTVLAQVTAALDGSGLSPALLEIAFAEQDLTDEGSELLLLVSALRDLGVGVALDGSARLAVAQRALRRLPLTAIRLRPDLTHAMEADADSRTLVAHAIRLAHAAGTTVTAQDVRTTLQRDILADLRCDEAQGPLFALPMKQAAFRAALAEHR